MSDGNADKPAQTAAEGATPEPLAGKPRRLVPRWLKITLCILAAVVVAACASAWWYSRSLTSSLAALAAKARDKGVVLSYADPYFAKWNTARPLSPEINAAIYYEEAFKLLPDKLDPATRARLPFFGKDVTSEDPRDPVDAETLAAMREFVAANAAVYDLVHRAAAAPECYFTIEWKGPETLMPHLNKARTCARLLVLKIFLDASEDRTHDAVESILDGLALGRGLQKEPMLYSGLVSFAIRSWVLGWGGERLLSQAKVSRDDLVALQGAVDRAAEELSLRDGIAGEAASQWDTYDRIASGEYPLPSQGPQQESRPLRWPLNWFGRAYLRLNLKRSIDLTLELVDAAGKPTPENLSTAYHDAWTEEARDKKYILSCMLLSSLSRSTLQCEAARARFRSAAACVAALRSKNDTGAWPETLDALVPKYIAKVPEDPFTGKPLIYRVDENGIRIYSVGWNGADDEGRPNLLTRPQDVTESEWWNRYDDRGFRVWLTPVAPVPSE